MTPLSLFSLLVLFAFAAAQDSASYWGLSGVPAPSDKVHLIIAVKQQNLAQLNKIFWEVSTPTSPQYGKYLTGDEVSRLVMPSEESISGVLDWLSAHGIQKQDVAFTRSRDFISFDTTVSVASALLSVKYVTYKHISNGRTIIKAADEYVIPAHLTGHVDFVAGHIGFPLARTTLYSVEQGPYVFPANLRERYNVTDGYLANNSASSNSVAEFQSQYYNSSDLEAFFKSNVPFAPNDGKVAKVVGGNENDDPGVEASLDIEYIKGVAPNVSSWFWSNPDLDFFTDMVSWLSQIDNTTNPPWVHSVSYGSQSEWPSSSIHDRVDTEFQKSGARGLSIIFASGDSGTGCILCVKFRPSWPASSQYVTAVGATTFQNGTDGYEIAVNAFSSGGGFSEDDTQPSYQAAAVKQYFAEETDLPDSHFYDKDGRGTPDVAALGWNFGVVVGGELSGVGGTSASAPTFSAIITLLNDIRFNQGKASLGFLNPWLYQTQASNPDAFFDVTVGDNQDGCCGFTGFKCAKGWDPVTGLGTPNFAVLSTLV